VSYESLPGTRVPVKMWTVGVPVEQEAQQQIRNVAELPIVAPHVAVMPDVHWGIGATVGTVVPTVRAIIPAAVGVDIGCGMIAVRTNLTANDLDGKLATIRAHIEVQVPVGGPGQKGSWDHGHHKGLPSVVEDTWVAEFAKGWRGIRDRHPLLKAEPTYTQLGTLGTGNHFIEVCRDEADDVWIMLHSGSRGVGNRIGTYFIAQAKELALQTGLKLTDTNLSWLDEGTQLFDDYVTAVGWAQKFARKNRELMLANVTSAIWAALQRPVLHRDTVVNCHHNYVQRETHFGHNVWVTRKGAVQAFAGDMGIIPGSMGARSFIVRGKGNPDSFMSCSHGAGRRMSRSRAKVAFTLEDHARATEGVECRKDIGVIDETPGAYKDIDAVIEAQKDLVEVVHTLRQVVCVKG
jgi:tRNA-splicing ligase RtcB